MNSYMAIKKHKFLKASRPHTLFLIRLGDYYYTYGQDAKDLANELNLVLISQQIKEHSLITTPSCAVASHAIEETEIRLTALGYEVSLQDIN